VRQALWQPLAGQLNAFRKEIGLEPLSRSDGPALNDDGADHVLLLAPPGAKAARVAELGAHHRLLARRDAEQRQLRAAKGARRLSRRRRAPIYVGFGSITGINDVDAFFDKVVQAMEQSGERCILLTGWANLGANRKLSDRIHVLESVPHDWLFPQCKAVVHHGGAGTVATGLRAACPTIVLAFFADQFFWASRVVELGVGHEENGVVVAKNAIYGILAHGNIERAIINSDARKN
jgi:UDP:flavonoid glycosyltransferase YjiC (YdhE family)